MNNKVYDLEERTFLFAKRVRVLVKSFNGSMASLASLALREDSKQIIRSSGSIGANYIEANEKLSKKDFVFRIKICRKEAKESAYWLKLIKDSNELANEAEVSSLINEAEELKKIFSSIVVKSI